MSDKLSNGAVAALATIIAALITASATFLAAKQTLRIEATTIEGDKQSFSLEAASNEIENLSRQLATAENRLADCQQAPSNAGNSQEERALRQEIQSLEEQVAVKNQLIQALRSSDPDPNPPQPPPPGKNTETKGGVTIDFVGCNRSGRTVTCVAKMTLARNEYNHVAGGSNGSFLSDAEGNQYRASRVKLGSSEGKYGASGRLPAGIGTRIETVFEGVPQSLVRLDAIVIRTYQQDFMFENITLQ